MPIFAPSSKIYTPVRDIVLQTPKDFEKTINGFREVAPFPKYSIQEAVASTEPKYTKNANTCAILGMSNGKTTYLGHFAPELHSAKFKEQLERDVKRMQDETGELSAVITGGYDYNAGKNINQAKTSFDQLAEIGEVLDKADAKLTMIAGKKNPVFVDDMAVTSDKFILSQHDGKLVTDVMPELRKYNNKIGIEQALENRYGIVEIEPSHNIFIG